MTQSSYPAWICWDCGNKHGRMPEGHCATFHKGDACGWCGKETATTEPRDFRYPPAPKEQSHERE